MMHPKPLPTIGRVECRSEGRGDEHPVAVVIGDRRFAVTQVLDRAVISSAVAGEPIRHRLWVELEDGRRCELSRTIPDGAWRVDLEVASGAD